MEVATVVVTEVDTVVATEGVMEEDMAAMEADMAVMVTVDTEDTAMGANGDQLNPATDMAATEEAMVVMEAMVDMEAMVVMVVMEVMVATDMVDMDIMVETVWTSNHMDRRTKELEL